jgi:L-phenylalanine/L-methionine N-acetyltransferase
MAQRARPDPSFVIRAAAPRDARSFLELYRTVADEGRFIRTERPARDVGHYRRAFRASVTSGRARLVAVEGDRVVGEIGIEREEHPVTRHVATIGMMVAPDRRGAGVGSALLRAAIDWARRSGVEKLELSVYPDNDAARALYRKFGFTEEGRLTGHSKKRTGYLDEVMMGRWLIEAPS